MTGDRVLITGGAGFVATNVADRLLRDGARVRVFDNLSRAGVEHNVRWLREQHGDRVELQVGDIRDAAAVAAAVVGVDTVYHFAAQVAVTTSLTDPFLDFDVNARVSPKRGPENEARRDGREQQCFVNHIKQFGFRETAGLLSRWNVGAYSRDSENSKRLISRWSWRYEDIAIRPRTWRTRGSSRGLHGLVLDGQRVSPVPKTHAQHLAPGK